MLLQCTCLPILLHTTHAALSPVHKVVWGETQPSGRMFVPILLASLVAHVWLMSAVAWCDCHRCHPLTIRTLMSSVVWSLPLSRLQLLLMAVPQLAVDLQQYHIDHQQYDAAPVADVAWDYNDQEAPAVSGNAGSHRHEP